MLQGTKFTHYYCAVEVMWPSLGRHGTTDGVVQMYAGADLKCVLLDGVTGRRALRCGISTGELVSDRVVRMRNGVTFRGVLRRGIGTGEWIVDGAVCVVKHVPVCRRDSGVSCAALHRRMVTSRSCGSCSSVRPTGDYQRLRLQHSTSSPT